MNEPQKIPTTKKFICLDIETTGLLPAYGSRITCICAKDEDGKEFSCCDRDEAKILKKFNEWLIKRDIDEYYLLTKNGKQFDIPFIIIRSALSVEQEVIETTRDILHYEHFDLQELTTKRVSLQVMAELLNCTPKSGTGSNAIKLWDNHKYKELEEYCMQDVLTTIEVFQKWKRLK